MYDNEPEAKYKLRDINYEQKKEKELKKAAPVANMEIFIPYKESRLRFVKFGSGNELLFYFHGFEENAETALALAPALAPHFTVFSLDWIHHGWTEWREQNTITPEELAEVLKGILDEEKVENFSMMGFSMGGKIALSLVPLLSNRINSLLLVAPDGLQRHKLYDLAIYSWWGKRLFKILLHSTSILFAFVWLGYKLRIINRFLYYFTRESLNTRKKRVRLYRIWRSIRYFDADIEDVIKIINQNEIKTHLIFGKNDDMFPQKIGKKYQKKIKNSTLTIAPGGHLLINSKLNPHLQPFFHGENASET